MPTARVLSIAGAAVQKSLHITKIDLGYIFSAFAMSYAVAQIPGGFLLDRFGAKLVYAFALVLWSLFTLLHGFAGFFIGGAAVSFLFAMRFLVGLASAPGVPANARIVASWFPTSERGTASAIFNATQYFAPFAFNWLLAWIVTRYGWPSSFYFMGVLGLVAALVFVRFVQRPDPASHDQPGRVRLYREERRAGEHRGQGRAVQRRLHLEQCQTGAGQPHADRHLSRPVLHQCADLFLHHLVSALSGGGAAHAADAGRRNGAGRRRWCGFAGGVLGGVVSDWLLQADRLGHLRAQGAAAGRACCWPP